MELLSTNVAFDGIFDWLLAGFGVFVVLTLAWLLVGSFMQRLRAKKESGPRKGRPASGQGHGGGPEPTSA